MNNIDIPNITKTASGIAYAYEAQGKFQLEFIANCKEDDEEYYNTFFTPNSYTSEQLQEIGNDLATIYGAVCTGIEKVVKHRTDGTLLTVKII